MEKLGGERSNTFWQEGLPCQSSPDSPFLDQFLEGGLKGSGIGIRDPSRQPGKLLSGVARQVRFGIRGVGDPAGHLNLPAMGIQDQYLKTPLARIFNYFCVFDLRQ